MTQHRKNQVLQEGFRVSENFYKSDRILHEYLQHYISEDGMGYMREKLVWMGEKAAIEMDELSLRADQQGPELIKRNRYGETIDEIRFHPAYDRMLEIAVESEMMRVKWEPELRARFVKERNQLGFAAGFLYGMAESGQFCPLCMTDGVAVLIDRFADKADQERLLPHIYTDNPAEFFTGAMFLTEKAGGSDVGANLVAARPLKGEHYTLHGEKWFCSNVNAEIIFALARTDPDMHGTRGLSIFLVEKTLKHGERNPLNIVRLKDKLGVRSMASAECLLDGTVGKRVGEEFQGFRIMTEMINISRLYNSVAAVSAGRRALVEAYQFLSFRVSFGKRALEHALVRAKLWELGSLHLLNFHLCWRAIRALDAAENGNEAEGHLLRLLTPMLKRDSAEIAVYLARESMELMGGMGYIEDTVIPKIMRDVMVLPIWEGAGNIMVLDMMRAMIKSEGLAVMMAEIEAVCAGDHEFAELILDKSRKVLAGIQELRGRDQESMEFLGKDLLLELTRCYQAAVLLQDWQPSAAARIRTALYWLLSRKSEAFKAVRPPAVEEISELLAWDF